jgi:hypothetical protein
MNDDKHNSEKVSVFYDFNASNRHRQWGDNLWMADIDFLVIEYSLNRITAMIDYKLNYPKNKYYDFKKQPGIKALIALCNMAGLPFFIVCYCQSIDPNTVVVDGPRNERRTWGLKNISVLAMNATAIGILNNEKDRDFTELNYVKFLYKLRDEDIPDDIEQLLSEHEDRDEPNNEQILPKKKVVTPMDGM